MIQGADWIVHLLEGQWFDSLDPPVCIAVFLGEILNPNCSQLLCHRMCVCEWRQSPPYKEATYKVVSVTSVWMDECCLCKVLWVVGKSRKVIYHSNPKLTLISSFVFYMMPTLQLFQASYLLPLSFSVSREWFRYLVIVIIDCNNCWSVLYAQHL